MKPGLELSALIAEKVMGWNRKPHKWEDVPRYSTDIAAAWPIVEKFKEAGFLIQIMYGVDARISVENGKGLEVTEVRFSGQHGPDHVGHETGDTIPHAICLAALHALGVEVPA